MSMRTVLRFSFILMVVISVFGYAIHRSDAQTKTPDPIKIGFVGSLSSFAANYGTAVLEGAELAIKELQQEGVEVDLKIEDDQSVMKNSVSAYMKLQSVEKVQGIIGGTWWANSFVKRAEVEGMPILSCETLYNDNVVLGKTYFILHGNLRDWVKIYEPVVADRKWKKGAIVRYVSGFGTTLAREVEALFSRDGRSFAGSIEYNDLALTDTADIIVKLKKLSPDVVYVDGQPAGLANLLKKITEAGLKNFSIITHSAGDDVLRDNLFDLSQVPNMYFSRRTTFDADFAKKFTNHYKKAPVLNADLGYYSLMLMAEALRSSEPIPYIKNGPTVRGKKFSFDDHNVFSGTPEEIFKVAGGKAVPWQDGER